MLCLSLKNVEVLWIHIIFSSNPPTYVNRTETWRHSQGICSVCLLAESMCLCAAMRQKYVSNQHHESNIGISLELNRSTLNIFSNFSNVNALRCFLLWEIFFGRVCMIHTLSAFSKGFHFVVWPTHRITINTTKKIYRRHWWLPANTRVLNVSDTYCFWGICTGQTCMTDMWKGGKNIFDLTKLINRFASVIHRSESYHPGVKNKPVFWMFIQ